MTTEEAVAFIEAKVNEQGYTIPQACDDLYEQVASQPDPNLWLMREISGTKLAFIRPPDVVRVIL